MKYRRNRISLRRVGEFALTLFSNWVLQKFVCFIFPFIITYVMENSNKNKPFNFTVFYSFPQILYFSAYFLILVGFSACNQHILKQQKDSGLNRAVVEELQNNITSLTRYMLTLEKGEKEQIFASLSQFICNSLYTIFSNEYPDRSFRISVVKQFLSQNTLMYTMPGFKSNDLSSGDNRPRPVADCEKYFRTILLTSVEKLYLLDEKGVKKKFSPSREPLAEYLAIPNKGDFDNICFILQIDCTKAGSFGKNKVETENFVRQYIEPFVKLLENAYVQERMNFISRGAEQLETQTIDTH